MGLLPLLVVLPLLGTLLLVWGDAAFDRLLITKVRSDLAVAQGYFDRVLGEVGSGAEALATSHALHTSLLRGDPLALQALLQRDKLRLRLDFLNLYDASGAMRARDTGTPGETGLSQAELEAIAEAAPQHATITLLGAQQLAQTAPQWRERARIPLVPTRGAAATERTLEDRALVALARTAVQTDDGSTLGYVEGGVLLNRNLDFIDHINAIVYPEDSLPYGSKGTATLFLDDVRVTTNVRLFQDQRAIGTRVSKEVRDAVLGRGETWLDRAFVVNDWYVSGYQPLVDGGERRVGMLYVGYLERPFTLLKYGVLAAIVALFGVVMWAAAYVSLRWARSIFQPLERMTQTMQAVR
ncbi:MAG: cache domain-containing protein, partial [Rhizobacter sp.]|nr:cache domain-containing protein [Rhizobacter sp.]